MHCAMHQSFGFRVLALVTLLHWGLATAAPHPSSEFEVTPLKPRVALATQAVATGCTAVLAGIGAFLTYQAVMIPESVLDASYGALTARGLILLAGLGAPLLSRPLWKEVAIFKQARALHTQLSDEISQLPLPVLTELGNGTPIHSEELFLQALANTQESHELSSGIKKLFVHFEDQPEVKNRIAKILQELVQIVDSPQVEYYRRLALDPYYFDVPGFPDTTLPRTTIWAEIYVSKVFNDWRFRTLLYAHLIRQANTALSTLEQSP